MQLQNLICIILDMFDSLLTEKGLHYKFQQQLNQTSFSPRKKGGSKSPLRPNFLNAFPKRSFINILLIILTTLEVILIINAKVYMHSGLVRSFLSIYAERDKNPQLFQGNAFYAHIQDISQLQKNIQSTLDKINNSDTETLLNINYTKSNIILKVQYHPELNINKPYTFDIDPNEGISQPFDLSNLKSIQLFLLEVHNFQIVISNLFIQSDGLYEEYIHKIMYHYDDSNEIYVKYSFQIANYLIGNLDIQRPQTTFLVSLRLFYIIVLILSIFGLYLNARYIQTAFKQFHVLLQQKAHKKQLLRSRKSIFEDIPKQDIKQIDKNIAINIELRDITLNNLRVQDYLIIIEFDIIFSAISNAMQITGNIYLLFGREHQIFIGIGCLFSWMTIFKVLKKYKRLILMYELIKMSTLSIINFAVSFMIIFLAYTFLGMCLFSKVSFFCSMSDTVTTLFSMMAGDSIRQITTAICQKNSTVIAIIYIFTYIILFMHAIHNTLTSIIKQYFILKNMELLKEQKANKGEENYMYMQQYERDAQKIMNQFPLKLTYELQKDLVKIKREQKFNHYNKAVRQMIMLLQNLQTKQKWDVFDHSIHDQRIYQYILQRRYMKLQQFIQTIDDRPNKLDKSSQITVEVDREYQMK